MKEGFILNPESDFENLQEYGPTRDLKDLLRIEISGDRKNAAEILDSMGLKEREKMEFYRYFLWQQWGGSALKELGDIREESFVSLVHEINDNEQKRAAYGEFYTRFQGVVLIRLFRNGAELVDVSEETEIPLSKVMEMRWQAFDSGSLRLQPTAKTPEEVKKLLKELGLLDFSVHSSSPNAQDKNLRTSIAELELVGMTEQEIADALNINKSTAHNYLTTLKKQGFENKRARQKRTINEMLMTFAKEFSDQYPGKPVRLWYLIRDKKTTSDYRRLVRCYEELLLTKDLPPISRGHNSLDS